MSQPQLRSPVNHPPQNYTTTFDINHTNLNPNSSAIYTTVNRIENPINGMNSNLERSLHLSASAAKEHYISNATT